MSTSVPSTPDKRHRPSGELPGAVEVLEPRDVPLGGPRAMTVRRTLPQRDRTLIGAWCFLDHFGPDPVAATGGMRVPRHPHTGLATVTWLFTGKVAHRDSAGYQAVVRAGEVNLMVAGRGISHQEFSTPDTEVLHGTQLWFALPDRTRHMAPTFEHHAPSAHHWQGAELRVFIGSLAGSSSPVTTYSPPLFGAEVLLPPATHVELPLETGFEHGVLLDSGDVRVEGTQVAPDYLAYLETGRDTLTLQSGDRPTRLLLIGGEPLGEEIVMWWNFIGRSHDEVESYRAVWQVEAGFEARASDVAAAVYPDGAAQPRFGKYPTGMPAPLPAPVLPAVRLRPRG